jgi:hypothetical protein
VTHRQCSLSVGLSIHDCNAVSERVPRRAVLPAVARTCSLLLSPGCGASRRSTRSVTRGTQRRIPKRPLKRVCQRLSTGKTKKRRPRAVSHPYPCLQLLRLGWLGRASQWVHGALELLSEHGWWLLIALVTLYYLFRGFTPIIKGHHLDAAALSAPFSLTCRFRLPEWRHSTPQRHLLPCCPYQSLHQRWSQRVGPTVGLWCRCVALLPKFWPLSVRHPGTRVGGTLLAGNRYKLTCPQSW